MYDADPAGQLILSGLVLVVINALIVGIKVAVH
jgi:hypothetical protein